MADNLQLIEQYIKGKAPDTELDIVLCMAEVKAKYNAVQNYTAKYFGISERTLKNYKAKFKAEFEARLEETMAEEVNDLAGINPNQFVSEEQTDKFFRVMYEKAVSPQGTARDRELYMEATGLSGRDYFHLQSVKANTLRWFIKQNLGKIGQYMDTKELGIMLQSSPYLYSGDKESAGNTERFIDKSLDDESFKLELMMAGLAFYSLYNGTQHPDLELLQTVVKLDRIEQNIKEPMNMNEVKDFAKGEDIVKDAPKAKDVDKTKIEALLQEIDELTSSIPKANEVKASDYSEATNKINNIVRTTKLPEIEDVEAKVSEHYEELQVLLTAEEKARAWMRQTTNKTKGDM